MSHTINYQSCFDPYINKFKHVILDESRSNKLKKAIATLIEGKQKQLRRKLKDTEIADYKKLYMQLAGDVVMEQYLNMDFVDYENFVNNKKPYLNTILRDGKIDIVTFSYGLFPLVYKTTFRKTIFICMMSNTEFYICGIGEPFTINGYSRADLVQSDKMRGSGRAAFYALYNLQPIPSRLGEAITYLSK